MKKYLSLRRAFTLVEIVIVMTIISVLVTMSLVSYEGRKKKSELRGTIGVIRMIAAAHKNYFKTFNLLASSSGTADTNTLFGLNVRDGYFRDYRVVAGAGSPPAFNVTVFSGTASNNATYIFDSNGTRLDCAGTDCIPDW